MLIDKLPALNKLSIVLASGSPRRRELLTKLGLRFEVRPSTFEENLDKSKFTPATYVIETAYQKALQVYEEATQGEADKVADIVISADTVVALGDKILEKPRSEEAAFDMLSSLSGSTHKVHTGVTIMIKGKDGPITNKFSEETTVTFAELGADLIRAYIASGEPMDKAGGYGIQDVGGSFVTGIQGCYFNVVGFPVHRFCKELVAMLAKQE